MGNYKVKFGNSIKRKLLMLVILTAFIPLLILGQFSIYYSGKIMNKKTANLSVEILKQVHNGLNNQFRNLDDLSLKLIVSSEIQKYLSEGNKGDNAFDDKFNAQNYIQQTLTTNMNVTSAEVLGKEDKKIKIGYDFDDGENYKDTDWYKLAKEHDGDIVFSSLNGETYITVSRLIKNSDNEEIGVLKLAVTPQFLSDVYRDTNLGENSKIYIVNKSGSIQVSLDDKRLNKLVAQNIISEFKNVKDKAYTKILNIDSKAQMLTVIPLGGFNSDNRWFIIAEIPQATILKDTNVIKSVVTIVLIVCILFTAILAILFSRNIINPINKLVKAAYKISEGDLSVSIDTKSNDEVGKLSQAFDIMVKNMNDLIIEIKEMGATVSTSSNQVLEASNNAKEVSEQISLAVNDIAKGALNQAEDVQDGSNMLVGVVNGLDNIANMLLESKDISKKATDSINQGVKTVEYQQNKMLENKNASSNVANAVNQLFKKTNEIENIINVINAISRETDLLALNAAIEAARAGEAGKGFAVVASQIRKLAEESASSSNKISDLIVDIESHVKNAVDEINISNMAVEEQEQAVLDTSDKFETIRNVVSKFVNKIENVYASVETLNQQASVVGSNISNIANIVEENASASEEVSASAEEQTATMIQIYDSTENLVTLSEKLEKAISKFSI